MERCLSILNNLPAKEFFPGFHGRMIHSSQMTLAFWDIDADASAPMHTHVHEQVIYLLEGTLELTIEDDTFVLRPGSVFVIPPNVPHGARALEACKILDIFAPVREDYL